MPMARTPCVPAMGISCMPLGAACRQREML